MADAAERRAAALAVEAELLYAQAGELRRLAEVHERSGLQHTGRKGTVGTHEMEGGISRGAQVSASKTRRLTPWTRALQARGLSPQEWARSQRKPSIEPETARAWVKQPKKGGRATPRAWADRIALENRKEGAPAPGEGFDPRNPAHTDVPAVAASWPNGIREPVE